MKWIRYNGQIVGWQTKRRRFLIDALTARAIERGKGGIR